jgi:hypothetical protein
MMGEDRNDRTSCTFSNEDARIDVDIVREDGREVGATPFERIDTVFLHFVQSGKGGKTVRRRHDMVPSRSKGWDYPCIGNIVFPTTVRPTVDVQDPRGRGGRGGRWPETEVEIYTVFRGKGVVGKVRRAGVGPHRAGGDWY